MIIISGLWNNECYILKVNIPPRRGRAFASHEGDRGSIPGRDRRKS